MQVEDGKVEHRKKKLRMVVVLVDATNEHSLLLMNASLDLLFHSSSFSVLITG